MQRQHAIRWLKGITYIGIYGGLLMPMVFLPAVIFPFVFSKLLFLQILIGLTLPAYIILAIVEPAYRPRWAPLYTAIFAYFVALLLSVIFAVDPARAWWGNQERMNGLFTLLHFFAWLTMATSMLKTWSQWKKLLIYEVAISAAMAVVALLQKPFPNLLAFPAGPRVGGLLDNPIYMAAYQIFNLFFILLLWLRGVSRNTKIALVLFTILDVGAFFAAQSRGALVGLAAGVGVFSVTYAIMTPHRKIKAYVLGAAALFFFSYGILFSLRNTEFVKSSPLSRLTNLQETSGTRFIAWDIAWKGFLERPLTGWGLDTFHILFNEKYNPVSLEHGYYETWFDRAHNTVMDALSMTGIFGTVTFFSIFGMLFYSVLRAYRKRWIDIPTASIFFALPVAYFIQNLFVFDQPAGFTMSFLLYAFVICATAGEFTGHDTAADHAKPIIPGLRNVPWIAFLILQLIAVLLVWRTSILPAKASYYTIKSNSYFAAGLYDQAFVLAKTAATFPTPYLDEQTFLQSRNLISLMESGAYQKFSNWKEWYKLVVDVTDRHLVDHMRNTHPHFIYARFLDSFIQHFPENAKLAEEQYLWAVKTSPTRQQILFNLGRFYIQQGRKEEGYNLFRRAADLNPKVGESHWYAGITLMFDLGRREDGAKEVIQAFTSPVPYQMQSVRDAVTLATAYETVQDKAGFASMLPKLQTLGAGEPAAYVEIARIAERMNMIPERDAILNALMKSSPEIVSRFAPLYITHTATTIDESLKQTDVPVPAAPAPAPISTTPAPGTGPRIK